MNYDAAFADAIIDDIFFFFFVFQGLLKLWSLAPDDSDYNLYWILDTFHLGGRDSRFDRVIKMHNALKTFLDL